MKRIAIIAAAASAAAFSASAGEMAAFSDIDADASGTVSESEFVAHKTADGKLTVEEASDKFVEIDADADGEVTRDEMEAWKAEWSESEVGVETDTELDTPDTDY